VGKRTATYHCDPYGPGEIILSIFSEQDIVTAQTAGGRTCARLILTDMLARPICGCRATQ
jgi:hypothetical protein